MARAARASAMAGSAYDHPSEQLSTIISATNADGSPFSLPVVEGVADSLAASGVTAAAPASGTSVASIAAPPAGVYKISVRSFESGTPDSNFMNMNLRKGTTFISAIPSRSGGDTVEVARVTLDGSSTVNVVTGASAGGAGAVYGAAIIATRVE